MSSISLTRIGSIFAVLILGAAAALGQKPAPVPQRVTSIATGTAPMASDGMRRQMAFMTAWATLNRQYYDKTFGGVDWEKIRLEFEPKVVAAKTDREFHALLADMIRRLGKSHLAIIEPEYFDELKRAKSRARIYERRRASGI